MLHKQNQQPIPKHQYFRPVIYAICNRKLKKYYVGKTTRQFTKRWQTHVFETSDAGVKFTNEFRNTPITHWSFMILEIVEFPDELICAIKSELDEYVSLRECYWIDRLNSIDNGYNTKYSSPKHKYTCNGN